MTWSLSKLKTYEQCPAKYKYQHIDKLEGGTSVAASRGVEIHAELEGFLKGSLPKLSHSLSMYEGWLGGLREKQPFPEHQVALDRKWSPTLWVGPDTWLRSILDLKVVQEKEGTVYDWKTGKVYPDHDDQKELYSLTTFAEHPEVSQVRAIHVYVDLGKNTEKTYHRDNVPDMQRRWNPRVAKLEQETEFLPNPQFLCRYCPFSKTKGGPCRF